MSEVLARLRCKWGRGITEPLSLQLGNNDYFLSISYYKQAIDLLLYKIS